MEVKNKKKMNAVVKNDKDIRKAFGYVSGIEKRSKKNGKVVFNLALRNFQQDLKLKVGDLVFIKHSKKLAEKYLKKKTLQGLLEEEKIELTFLDNKKFQISKIQKEFSLTKLLDLEGVYVAKIVIVKHVGSDITISGALLGGPLPHGSFLRPGQCLEVGAVAFSLEEIAKKKR